MSALVRRYCLFSLVIFSVLPKILVAQLKTSESSRSQSRSAVNNESLGGTRPPSGIAQQIDALMNSNLDASVDPASLFDVDINSESAVQLERERLAVYPKNVGKVDSPELQIRLELDAAGLQFYIMPQSERSEFLRLHFEKRELNDSEVAFYARRRSAAGS